MTHINIVRKSEVLDTRVVPPGTDLAALARSIQGEYPGACIMPVHPGTQGSGQRATQIEYKKGSRGRWACKSLNDQQIVGMIREGWTLRAKG